MRLVSEAEFSHAIKSRLVNERDFGWVTGAGRSGAIAAVYASHILSIPFVPYGSFAASNLGKLLIIDTAIETGKTLRKASNKYKNHEHDIIAIYDETKTGRVYFWYEAPKPQRYKHEKDKP